VRKHTSFLLLAVIASVATSLAALGAVLTAYESWVGYRNPYADIVRSAVSVEVSGEPLAEHLVFVLLDGASVDVLESLRTPGSEVGRLLSMGAYYPNGVSALPSYSMVARASLLTGTPPELHEVSSNDYVGELAVDSLLRVAKERGFKVLCSGDPIIASLFEGLLDEYADIPLAAGHGALSLRAGLEMLRRHSQNSRVLLWVNVADPDEVGHLAGGPASEVFNSTVANAAALTLAFLEDLRKEGLLDKTLVVVLNDHGFKRGGHHGGPEPEVTRVFTLFVGPRVKPGRYESGFTQYDIAPTVAMIMGWRIPAASLGKPLLEGFDVDPARAAAYADAARAQGLRLVSSIAERAGLRLEGYSDPLEAYLALARVKAGEGALERGLLAALVAAAALAAAVLALRKHKPAQLKRDMLVVLTGLAVFEATFRFTYMAERGPWSLSDIHSLEELQMSILLPAALGGLMLGVYASLVLEHASLSRVLARVVAAVLAATAVGLACTLPTLVSYGPLVRFPFPDWSMGTSYLVHLLKVAFTGFAALPAALLAATALALPRTRRAATQLTPELEPPAER